MNVGRRIVLFLLLVEALCLAVTLLVSHGRIVDMLAWISAAQFALLYFWGLVVWTVKHQSKNSGAQLGRRGKVGQQVVIGVTAVVLIFILIVWVEVLVPKLVKLSVQEYGQTTTAKIISYKLINYGPKAAEYVVYDLSRADAIVTKLSYANHVSTIKADKEEPAFDLLYQASQKPSILQVRYLPILPSIVLPVVQFDYKANNPSFNFDSSSNTPAIKFDLSN